MSSMCDCTKLCPYAVDGYLLKFSDSDVTFTSQVK